jgi:photosystem I subunit 10
MIVSTTLMLAAGRFGLAPTANRNASAGLKLSENKAAGLYSNDPAGES